MYICICTLRVEPNQCVFLIFCWGDDCWVQRWVARGQRQRLRGERPRPSKWDNETAKWELKDQLSDHPQRWVKCLNNVWWPVPNKHPVYIYIYIYIKPASGPQTMCFCISLLRKWLLWKSLKAKRNVRKLFLLFCFCVWGSLRHLGLGTWRPAILEYRILAAGLRHLGAGNWRLEYQLGLGT